MAKGGTPKVSLPEYQKPTPDSFSSPYGNVTYGNGGFTFANTADDADFNNMLNATRNAMLKNFGGTDQATQDSLNQWQKTYFDEAQRLSQPQLENSLFDRGLGGSSFYGGSLNDLISKNANQAILNKYALQNQDQTQKVNNLNAITGYSNDMATRAQNLLTLANTNGQNQDSLATQRWQATLPYLATYDSGSSDGYGKIGGAVLGGLGGAMFGNPLLGAQIGSGIGGAIDGSQGNTSAGGGYLDAGLSGLSLAGMGGGGFTNPFSKGVNANTLNSFGLSSAAPVSPLKGSLNSSIYSFL